MHVAQVHWRLPHVGAHGVNTPFVHNVLNAWHQRLQVALSNQSPYVKSAHRVSGLMLANHTSIRLLIEKCLRGFRKLFPKFYVDHYKDFRLFNDGEGNLVLDEFHDAAEVVQDLCDEYKACEQDDYIDSGFGGGAAASEAPAADARMKPQRAAEAAR